jgi:tetratricopeptide (TPR) repeat protein
VRTHSILIAASLAAGFYGASPAPAQTNASPPGGLPKFTLPLPGDDEEIPRPPRSHALRAAPQMGPQQKAASEPDAAPELPPEEARKQKLDDLFARLAASKDADETNGLVAAIDRTLLQSDSDTDDFLMARAIAAMGTKNTDTALALLDRLVEIAPDWAEAWNKRATVRFMTGDQSGSMADIAQTVQREPRHFGALSGMGMILEQRGFRASALRAYRRVLEIAPQMASAKAAVERLEAAERGQGL